MSDNNNNKLEEVQLWLNTLYDYSEAPEFEVNDETIDMLYELITRIKEREMRNKILQDDIQQHILEIEDDFDEKNKKLSNIKCTPDLLPFEGQQVLDSLAEIGVSLNLKAPDMTSYLTALSDLMEEHEELDIQIREFEQGTDQLKQNSIKYLSELNFNKKMLANHKKLDILREKNFISQSKELEYFHAKQKQYQNSIAQSRESIKNTGVSTSITHSTLVTNFNKLQQLETNTKALTSKLAAFHNLPPDLTLAKIQLDQKHNELKKLQAEVDSNIDSINNWNVDSYY